MSTSDPPLRGQVAVVTGGGRGIGFAISKKLAEMGAEVVICGRSRETLKTAAAQIRSSGGECEAIPCDVSQRKAVENLAAKVEKKHARIDILVNNAGVADFGGPLHELPPEEWDRIINTNLRGVYYCMRAFAPVMIRARRGQIINISSIAAKNAVRNGAAYAASKWGLNGLSCSTAEELRGYNIRVAVVCPGSTVSELSPHSGKDTQKMLRGEDVAHIVAMLVTQAPQSFASEVVLRPTQKP
jgi:NAD(P)-dependent dehydrogenase (short-subunit alcohol dehydrogenase family)